MCVTALVSGWVFLYAVHVGNCVLSSLFLGKKMKKGEVIFPSFFCPRPVHGMVKTLVYMPSLNFCLFIDNHSSQIQILDLTSRSLVKKLAFEQRDLSRVIALSSDGRFLASDVAVPHSLPRQIRLSRLSCNGKDLKPDRSCCIEPGFGCDRIACLKFSPGGKNIFVTTFLSFGMSIGRRVLAKCDVSDNFWSNETDKELDEKLDKERKIEESATDVDKDSDTFDKSSKTKNSDHEESNVERYSQPGNSDKGKNVEVRSEDMNAGKNLVDGKDKERKDDEIRRGGFSDELNVLRLGQSIPPNPPESSSDIDRLSHRPTKFNTLEEYRDWWECEEIYCLAISPDTSRLLTGSNHGIVFVIDEDSLNVLQYIQACSKYSVVSGCHYNPVFAHDEFATCGGDKLSGDHDMLNIWRVEHLESDTEKASCVHSLSLESNPAKCCYSPDGKLVAVTCDSLFTYIVCSRSGVVLYTLAYEDEQPRPIPGVNLDYLLYSQVVHAVTLFAGRTCQVLTTPNHENYSIAIWNLPVVYSLETLCLLVLRATIKYGNIDALCIPTSLKLRLKYLYV